MKRDLVKKRLYQIEWLKKRRNSWIEANGPCNTCGSYEKLEIDHIDPSTKEFHPQELWSRKKETQLKELAKCQVLCEKCHLEKTRKDLSKMQTGRPINKARKLTKKQVFLILDEYFKNKISRRKIAAKYNVRQGTISHIIYEASYCDWVKEYKEMASG